MKKLLSLCLAILMILSAVSALASCGETTPDQTTDKTTESATARTDEGQTTETEEQKPAETVTKPAIPETDRDALLKVLHWTVDETWIPWEEICLFDFTGDVIDDAIYSRTSELHEKFGISLENEYMYVSDITHKVKNMTSSGTDEYQLIVQRSYQMQYSMMDDVFDNLSSLPHVDLSQPYWSQVSVDTFTFGGVTLFAASDMLLMDKSSTAAVAFNTSLANDHGWGGTYFYDLVRNNEWTFQKLVETASQAYVDLDGDTVVGPGDIFGAQGGDSPIHFLFNGSGEMFCRNTKDDRFLEYTFDKERCYNVIMDVLDLMVYHGYGEVEQDTVYEFISEVFRQGHQILGCQFSLIFPEIEYLLLYLQRRELITQCVDDLLLKHVFKSEYGISSGGKGSAAEYLLYGRDGYSGLLGKHLIGISHFPSPVSHLIYSHDNTAFLP